MPDSELSEALKGLIVGRLTEVDEMLKEMEGDTREALSILRSITPSEVTLYGREKLDRAIAIIAGLLEDKEVTDG